MTKGVHLTILMGQTIPLPLSSDVTDALDNISITVNTGQRSGFQLVFNAGRISKVQTQMIPMGSFSPGVRVIIIATVNGIPNVLMDGVITRQDSAPGNKPGSSTLTVTGEDISLLMDLDKTLTLPYPNMPASARVMFILAKYARYGMIPLVIPELFPEVPLVLNEIPMGQGTDLEYINKLADDNGYVFYVEPGPVPGTNTAYFGPQIRVGIPQPALTTGSDSSTNIESISFNFDGTSFTQKVVQIKDPIFGLPINIPLPEIGILSPPLALYQPAAMKQEKLEDTSADSIISAMSRGLAKVSASADAVSGSGSLDVVQYGHVLRARGLVGVRGAGWAYDGLYYVKSVSHKLKRGEYKQNFTVVRNGLIPLTPAVPA